jgi:hypothetical protein
MIPVIAGVVLGLVMCLAGGAKIAMGSRWPVQARSMGAPKLAIPTLPWIEVAIGALLISRVQTTVVGIAAMILILAFTILIMINLMSGRRPVCACFGTLNAKPLGWGHVARNALLAGLALISMVA